MPRNRIAAIPVPAGLLPPIAKQSETAPRMRLSSTEILTCPLPTGHSRLIIHSSEQSIIRFSRHKAQDWTGDVNPGCAPTSILTGGATTRNSRCGAISEGREALGTAGQEAGATNLAACEKCGLTGCGRRKNKKRIYRGASLRG